MKKVIAIVSIVLLTALSFTVDCNNKNSNEMTNGENNRQQKIILIFGTNRLDIANSTLESLVLQYNKLHHNINIQIQTYRDIDAELKIKAASGGLPDIGPIPDDADSKYFNLYYEPLDDMGFNMNNLYGCIYGVGYDGKLYGLNSGVNYSGIVYNKRSFRTAGIDKPPVTMMEFYKDCAKLKAKGITPFASNFKDKWTLSQYSNMCILPVSKTGNPNYKNDLVNQQLFTNDNGLKESFNFLRTMNTNGFLENDLMDTNWENAKKQQASGAVAMTYLASWYSTQLIQNGADESNIGMFPFPDTKVLPQSPDWLYAISKNSKHIHEAKAFLKWLWEDDRYAKACGINSPLKNAKVHNPITKEILSYGLPIVNPRPSSLNFNRVYSNSQIDLQEVLQEYITSKDPQDVLNKCNSRWENAKK